MQFQPQARQLGKLISRRMQLAFGAGLVVGVFLGWLFSGAVSAIMRVGIVAVLLIPLALAVWFWWRVRQANKRGGAAVFTWSGQFPASEQDPFGSFRHDRRGQDVIEGRVVDGPDHSQESRP